MSISFSKSDLSVFQIPDFAGRMAAMREKIRPKLEEFGDTVSPLLEKKFKQDFFPHTAKHMRRKVNPPGETWVALGPQARGYKAYIFFALCIGKHGLQARVVMKDESPTRPQFGKALQKNAATLIQKLKNKDLFDFTQQDENFGSPVIEDLKSFFQKTSERLQKLKGAHFDVGLELDPFSQKLEQDFVKACEKLYSIFECGLK